MTDNLTYTYLGNRLSTITDGSGSNLGVKNGVSNYGYDGNGNMTSDGSRGATLTYNYLNLPKTITIGPKTATYDYDATGSKQKYVFDTLTLKYAGKFEYRQVGNANSPYRVSLSEGQAVFRNNNIKFEYYLKDHLGNVRLVFDEKGQTLQRTDYYPFGLEIDRNNPVQQAVIRNGYNRYLYNGKELQVGIGYLDYGPRMYMPEVGRWGIADPLAEKGGGWSPYGYAFDNPMRFVDPDGMWPGEGIWSRVKDYVKEKVHWNSFQLHFRDYAKRHPINAAAGYYAGTQGERLERQLGDNPLMNGETTVKTFAPHDGGLKNAIKHTFTTALLSSKIGQLDAQEVADLNEQTQINGVLREMDLLNNEVGVEIGGDLSILVSSSDVLSRVLDAGLAGKLTIVTYDENKKERVTKLNLADEKYKEQVAKIRMVIENMRKDKEAIKTN